MNEFGSYIKKFRESKNMTLNQVALYAEISAAQLSRIETGKRGTPKPPTIEKIARALKVDYND
ncbi:helix-turn-helix domain-containing protein [Lysinibacillus sp. JK80]|uniref:helix-turn-helix domain-containing protein n=1 Tax=Lysinibacillus sp. JK80 TaxID=2749809 RepID=UPI0022B9BC64|nr:helix-turn-helix transcriptional regulator [Lysinibacillus sp. JK80]WBF54869.1 helix-turn-helix domain-containing protein [Lysinibacillus sp. JK80]